MHPPEPDPSCFDEALLDSWSSGEIVARMRVLRELGFIGIHERCAKVLTGRSTDQETKIDTSNQHGLSEPFGKTLYIYEFAIAVGVVEHHQLKQHTHISQI